MFYHTGDSQHTQNIQINKVIGENEKCVFSLTAKLNRLFGPPNTMSVLPKHQLRGRREMKTEIKAKPKGNKPYMSDQGLWAGKRLKEVSTRTEA